MQRFISAVRKRLGLIIAIFITVQAIGLCCVSVAYANDFGAAATESATESAANALLVDACTEKIGSDIYQATHSRGEWLYALMTAAGIEIKCSRSDREGIYREAVLHRIIGTDTDSDPNEPVTRRFAAATLVKAFGYPQRNVGYLSDVKSSEYYMQTAVYYGYFVPDLDYCVYPDARLTDEELDSLRIELDRCRQLHGKRILSFGDSIMHGSGNGGEGISDMIAEKYGMTCTDYSVPGATMGVFENRGHIPDQLRKAYKNKEQADIILINGGTNDMLHTAIGEIHDSRQIEEVDEKDFTGGFEKCMWMLSAYWKDAPVVYIRVHDMDVGKQENEVAFGERALLLAEKWGAASVDLFTDTEFKTDKPFYCVRYTYSDPAGENVCDSIHPTAAGYAKYYLPLISDAVSRELNIEVSP